MRRRAAPKPNLPAARSAVGDLILRVAVSKPNTAARSAEVSE